MIRVNVQFIYSHNNPNNHAMLFFKWQSFPKVCPGKLVPIFQGVIRVNVPFIYKDHINPYAPLACGYLAANSQKDFGGRGVYTSSMQNLSEPF